MSYGGILSEDRILIFVSQRLEKVEVVFFSSFENDAFKSIVFHAQRVLSEELYFDVTYL